MNKTTLSIASKQITLYEQPAPAAIFLQPVDDHDESALDNQVAYIEQHSDIPFMLCAVKINQWGHELSPWKAPAVFGKEDFGDGAEETLAFIADVLIPELKTKYQLQEDIKFVIGGYSLAGLFALWCGYQTDAFSGIAAASPSVWFPGWIDYAKSYSFYPSCAYLSLGDREARTRNPVMATVADCIQEQHEIFKSAGVKAVLEWNQGNHFRESDIRTAKAFLYFLDN